MNFGGKRQDVQAVGFSRFVPEDDEVFAKLFHVGKKAGSLAASEISGGFSHHDLIVFRPEYPEGPAVCDKDLAIRFFVFPVHHAGVFDMDFSGSTVANAHFL